MRTTRLSSAVTCGAGNSLPSKNMPSCIPEKLLCEVCGKSFHHAAVLGRHRSLHRKDKVSVKPLLVAETIPCKACGKVFKNKRTFGCHRCSQTNNNSKTKPKLNRSLKHEEHKDGSIIAANFLKPRLLDKDAKIGQSIPVVPVLDFSNISENLRSKSSSTIAENIQSIKRITTKKSPTLIRTYSKITPIVQQKKDVGGSVISTIRTRAEIDVNNSLVQRKCSKRSQSNKCKVGSNTTDVKGKNIHVSLSCVKGTAPVTEKKKGRKPTGIHTCEICHKDFSSQSKLQKHATLHDPSKPFGCDVCGKFFDDARFVKTHRTLHEKKSRKECNVCGKVFNERIFYDIHCLTHVEQKPFRCDVCEDIFKDKTTFLRHCKGHKARTRKVAERFLSMKEVLKQKLEDSNRQS